MSTPKYKPDQSGRYTHLFENTNGAGDARPTALQIVQDEGLEGKLGDKVVLITGTSSGIGIETAKAMAATGAKLFLGVRDLSKGEDALKEVLKPGHVELLKLDLDSLQSVRSAAEDFKSKSSKLNILINNAGIMAVPTNVKTPDGFESQFGTNHLAHFLLFQMLKPLLLASATPEFPSRVVNVASSGHRAGGIHPDDYGLDKPDAYNPWTAYGQSKTANIYMANEIERRYGARHLHGWSLNPGGIMTGLQKHVPADVIRSWNTPEVAKIIRSPSQGAATSVSAALERRFHGQGGKYLEDCDVAGPVVTPEAAAPGYKPHAYDEEAEKRLWIDSSRMVGVSADD